MKNIVITGSKGTLGRAITEHLQNQGYTLFFHDRSDGDILKAQAKIDRLDGLIHTIGDFHEGSSAGSSSLFQELFTSNVLSAHHIATTYLEPLKKAQGTLITFGVAGLQLPAGKMAAYLACKNALASWTKSFAYEFGKEGIRANMICPGFVEGSERKGSPAVTSESIASLVAFLLSDEARAMTGQIIDISSGVRMSIS